jgi:hypothetical protein
MVGFQYFSGALADDDAGSHGVAGRYARHDGCIGNTQTCDSIDFKIATNHQLPTSNAGRTFVNERKTGKFHGLMAPTIPIGV